MLPNARMEYGTQRCFFRRISLLESIYQYLELIFAAVYEQRARVRWRDRERKDMDQKGLTIEDAKDRVLWTRRTRTADPRKVWDRADR